MAKNNDSKMTSGQALVGATLSDLNQTGVLSNKSITDNSTIAYVGGLVLDNGVLSNSFLPTMINRIVISMVDTKMYENPFKEFSSGDMPDGIGIQDLYINPIEPVEYQSGYNVNVDGQHLTGYADQFALFEPDVKTLYYTINSTKVFPISVKEQELRMAFENWDAFQKFVDRIVSILTNSIELYEFERTKKLLGNALELEHPPLKMVECLPYNDIEFSTDYVQKLQNLAKNFKFYNSKNNNWADYVSAISGVDEKYINTKPVKTFTRKEDLRLIQLTDVTSKVNVEVLATAFNIQYTNFEMQVTEVDDWSIVDKETYPTSDATTGKKYHTGMKYTNDKDLQESDATLGNYDYIDSDGKRHHREIYAILCDKHFIQIWDTLKSLKKAENGLSLYTNYFKHLWQTYALCSFCNAVALYSDTIIE